MKSRNNFLPGLAIVFLSIALNPNAAIAADMAAEKAPDFTLVSADGEDTVLSKALEDGPVVLFFWASWCPYCKALMPHLQSIHLEYGDDIRILAINFRDDGDSVGFIEDAGYEFTVLPAGDELAALYGVHATPGVIIVDQDRTIRFNLYRLPRRDRDIAGESLSHAQKAAYRAPYWAAEIRRSLDQALGATRP